MGVKAAVPLGICLLPSFLLIGIVPLVAASAALPVPSELGAGNHPPTSLPTRRSTGADARPRRSVAIRTTVLAGRIRRPHMRRRAMHHEHDERGITTAEYAVGTAAGAGLAGLLFKLLTGGFGEQLLRTCSTTCCPFWASGEPRPARRGHRRAGAGHPATGVSHHRPGLAARRSGSPRCGWSTRRERQRAPRARGDAEAAAVARGQQVAPGADVTLSRRRRTGGRHRERHRRATRRAVRVPAGGARPRARRSRPRRPGREQTA